MGRSANSGALTESVFYILLRLYRPAHGYALMKDIAEMTDQRVILGAGTLYGALDVLQKKGWIRALDEQPQDRKKEYIITERGKYFFEKEIMRLKELLQNAENTIGEKDDENKNEKGIHGYCRRGKMVKSARGK